MKTCLLIALLLLTTSCSSTSPDTGPDGRTAEPERSAAQTRAVETGEVTADDYEQAFREFQACMADGGYEVSDSGMTGNVYDYSFPQAATGAGVYEPCYEYHFSEIDLVWQLANEDFSYTTQLIKKCLLERGIEPQDTSREVNAQLDEHGISFGDC
ncbi:hypothetical protein Sked_33570 [Sanguibacter keddieii DSM 10542]|uniref:Lipoprotein n=1 Tax=Sanguibacter keddieii (strain ATCC 51767 / DSM 10542 / NCFB 3025 / ST-74) TaxID=446469 RepID=D1BE31_SANKS|nr:hypothetical protein [Sanguibacter keddieii]ACZ23252.1 hypothetical protein Sked_33570 [Sanguibacter keddieii DSM 10542]